MCPTKPIQNQFFVFLIKMFNYKCSYPILIPYVHFKIIQGLLSLLTYTTHNKFTFSRQSQCRFYCRLYYCHLLPPEANGRPFLGSLPRGPVCPSLYNFPKGLHPEVNNLYHPLNRLKTNKEPCRRHVYNSGTPSHTLFKIIVSFKI